MSWWRRNQLFIHRCYVTLMLRYVTCRCSRRQRRERWQEGDQWGRGGWDSGGEEGGGGKKSGEIQEDGRGTRNYEAGHQGQGTTFTYLLYLEQVRCERLISCNN